MSVEAPEIDQAPVRLTHRLYYGWVNLLMASFAMTATLPGRTHGLGLITKPLTEDPTLGVDEILFSYLNFWAIMLGSIICLPIGRAIDRAGVRSVLVLVAITLGLSVGVQSQVTTWMGLLITLILVRGFGQGALSVVSMAMIGKWFTRRLGIAMGVFSVLLAIGFIATTLGTGHAVGVYGWRATWLTISICLLAGLAPLGWLLVRNSPESMGLSVDHTPEKATNSTSATRDLSLWSAFTTPAFWIFTLGAAMFNLTWSAITLFQESLLSDQGFDHDGFVLVMGLLVAAGLPSNLLTGWLAIPSRLGSLLAIGMLVLAGSLAAFPGLQTMTHAVLYGTALGVSGGIITVIFFTAYGQAFGRTHLGAIQAAVQVVSVLASATGPVLLTWSKSQGSTSLFFNISAVVAILLAGLALLIKLPDRQTAGAPSVKDESES
jgi:MFS family permease